MIPNINDDDDNDSQYKCKQPFWLETFTICQAHSSLETDLLRWGC